jgi:hypothetical protein
MNDENYRKALDSARGEVAELLQARARIDARLSQLKATIEVLSGLVQEPPKLDQDESIETLDNVGISEAIRQLLKDADVGLTPIQIKAKLAEAGFDLSRYANSGAVIYNTLKRLLGQKEVVVVDESSGAPAYAIKPSVSEEIGRAFGQGIAEAMRKAGTGEAPFGPPLPQIRPLPSPKRN